MTRLENETTFRSPIVSRLELNESSPGAYDSIPNKLHTHAVYLFIRDDSKGWIFIKISL